MPVAGKSYLNDIAASTDELNILQHKCVYSYFHKIFRIKNTIIAPDIPQRKLI